MCIPLVIICTPLLDLVLLRWSVLGHLTTKVHPLGACYNSVKHCLGSQSNKTTTSLVLREPGDEARLPLPIILKTIQQPIVYDIIINIAPIGSTC